MRLRKHPSGAPIRPAGAIWQLGVVRRAYHRRAQACASQRGPRAPCRGAPALRTKCPQPRLSRGRLPLGCGSLAAIGMLLGLVLPAMAQQRTLIVAGYGGSFEQTMRKEVFPGFEAKHGFK